MAQARQLVIGTVVAAGLFGGALVGAVGTAQAQALPSAGIVGGGGTYPTTGNMPVTTVAVAQFPAAGLDPPYNPATIGVPTSVDITTVLGRADAAPPVAGTFPLAFMTQQPPSPSSR